MLAELIERVTGRDFREFVRTEIIDPLGLTRLRVGVPLDEQGDINELVNTGEPATRDELMAALGIPELPVTEVTPEALLGVQRAGRPGGRRARAAAASRTRPTSRSSTRRCCTTRPASGMPDVLADVKTIVRNTYPDFLGTPANRTLGLVLAGDDGRSNYRGMGQTVSAGTFGHNGAGGQIAWADPRPGLSFVYLTNGHGPARPPRRPGGPPAIASRAGNCARASA